MGRRLQSARSLLCCRELEEQPGVQDIAPSTCLDEAMTKDSYYYMTGGFEINRWTEENRWTILCDAIEQPGERNVTISITLPIWMKP